MIAVIAETLHARLDPVSLEVVAAAQQLGDVVAVLAGSNLAEAASELGRVELKSLVRLESPGLQPGASGALVAVLADWIQAARPDLVLCPPSYAARDYAPRLAARLKAPLATDCLSIRFENGRQIFTRPVFRGRLVADVELQGPPPHFATLQIGSTNRADVRRAIGPVPQEVHAAVVSSQDMIAIEAPAEETARSTDLSHAQRIVAVGRGIGASEHIKMIEDMARALDADLAASRPVCDAGWLPMDRQIGSSGQTVAPALYVAIGISGAIQHVVGMKGARTIVAINKDAQAPIFEIADYGVVGDLFEIVPALIKALEAE